MNKKRYLIFQKVKQVLCIWFYYKIKNIDAVPSNFDNELKNL